MREMPRDARWPWPGIAAWWAPPSSGDCARRVSTILTASRDEVDLRQQESVESWFARERPDYVFLVGTVGGILANATRPAEFIYDNLMIHATVVHAAHVHGVKKLLYLGAPASTRGTAPSR
ncbi:MAG: NAD-dependent epimerase/dehydratase family protein [Vicinamibacterales bacterium]